MGDPQAATGIQLPHRGTRRVLLGLALLCACFQTSRAAGETPQARPLPPVTDHYSNEPLPLPGVRIPAPVSSPAGPTFLYGYNSAAPRTAGGQQVAYFIKDANAPIEGNLLPSAPPVPSLITGGPTFFQVAAQEDVTPPGDQEKKDQPGDQKPAEGEAAKNGEQQTYGQAPTNNTLQFLRSQDVLLKPGKWQFDTGLVYTLFENDLPVPVFDPNTGVITNVIEGNLRQRLLYTPLAFRYGLANNVQIFSSLPMGYSNTQASTFGTSNSQNDGGIGDLTAGLSFHLMKGEDLMPDVIGTVGFTAPTGDFNSPLFGLVPGSNLGQGFWAMSGQVLCINRYDPIIVFYGGGFRHLFERSFSGVPFQPGEQIIYQFGVGFAANDRVTLSTALQGFYITNTSINNTVVMGSNLEPISLRVAATIVRNDCRILEPFVQFGLTQSAPAANLGIVVTAY